MKDSQYWKDYNQKRKEYLAHKARERRAKEKSIQPAERIQPLASERIQPSPSIQPIKEERIQPQKVVDQAPVSTTESIQPPLWSSHYSVLKPYCSACQQKGIPETEYAFCSQERVQDALSVRLPNRYVCNVYHWTLYQGQGKIGGKV